jgi:hypothetical protein
MTFLWDTTEGTVVDHEEDIADGLASPPIPATPAAVPISYTLRLSILLPLR